MPIVKCPNCGAERVVIEGKKKDCRKCGTKLTDRGGIDQPLIGNSPIMNETDFYAGLTLEKLNEKRPDLVTDIINQAADDQAADDQAADDQSADEQSADEKEPINYHDWRKDELIAELEKRGFAVDQNMVKANLIALLKENDGN